MRFNFNILAQNQSFSQRTMIQSAAISVNRCRNIALELNRESHSALNAPQEQIASFLSRRLGANEKKADVGKLTTRYRMVAAATAVIAETGCYRLQEAGRGSRGSRRVPHGGEASGRVATRRTRRITFARDAFDEAANQSTHGVGAPSGFSRESRRRRRGRRRRLHLHTMRMRC